MKIVQGNVDAAIAKVLRFCTQSQHIFFSYTSDCSLKLQPREFWFNAIYVSQQLAHAITYIERSPLANDESIHLQLNSFKLYLLFCQFILSVGNTSPSQSASQPACSNAPLNVLTWLVAFPRSGAVSGGEPTTKHGGIVLREGDI